VPRPSNLGSGLLMLFYNQLSTSGTGVGVKRARSAAHAHRFYDGLAKAVEGSFVWIEKLFPMLLDAILYD
jgi:hypothetical protein